MRHRHSRIRKRDGYTLVELIAVISVNAAMMAVAVGLLGTLLRTERQGQHHYEKTNALVRLADQFREDVATSRASTVSAEASGLGDSSQPAPPIKVLHLQAGDRRIDYLRDGPRLRRIEFEGKNVARREAYTLAELSDARFTVSEDKLVSLRMKLGADANVPQGDWQIDAQLARDWRFALEEEQ